MSLNYAKRSRNTIGKKNSKMREQTEGCTQLEVVTISEESQGWFLDNLLSGRIIPVSANDPMQASFSLSYDYNLQIVEEECLD